MLIQDAQRSRRLGARSCRYATCSRGPISPMERSFLRSPILPGAFGDAIAALTAFPTRFLKSPPRWPPPMHRPVGWRRRRPCESSAKRPGPRVTPFKITFRRSCAFAHTNLNVSDGWKVSQSRVCLVPARDPNVATLVQPLACALFLAAAWSDRSK